MLNARTAMTVGCPPGIDALLCRPQDLPVEECFVAASRALCLSKRRDFP